MREEREKRKHTSGPMDRRGTASASPKNASPGSGNSGTVSVQSSQVSPREGDILRRRTFTGPYVVAFTAHVTPSFPSFRVYTCACACLPFFLPFVSFLVYDSSVICLGAYVSFRGCAASFHLWFSRLCCPSLHLHHPPRETNVSVISESAREANYDIDDSTTTERFHDP